MTVFEVESEQVQELPPANMLSIKADGTHVITEFTTPLKPTPCSFEKIYFSRGNDPIVYRERKALGAALTPQIVDSLEDRFDKSAITYIPNTGGNRLLRPAGRPARLPPQARARPATGSPEKRDPG